MQQQQGQPYRAASQPTIRPPYSQNPGQQYASQPTNNQQVSSLAQQQQMRAQNDLQAKKEYQKVLQSFDKSFKNVSNVLMKLAVSTNPRELEELAKDLFDTQREFDKNYEYLYENLLSLRGEVYNSIVKLQTRQPE